MCLHCPYYEELTSFKVVCSVLNEVVLWDDPCLYTLMYGETKNKKSYKERSK